MKFLHGSIILFFFLASPPAFAQELAFDEERTMKAEVVEVIARIDTLQVTVCFEEKK